MKRLITRGKWKRHLAERTRSQAQARARFADYRRRRNAALARPAHPKKFHKTSRIEAPREFSLIQNPNEMIRFFKEIEGLAETRNVFVDMAGVSALTPDAIAGLLAAIHHGARTSAHFSGNVPKDGRLSDILNRSGFREYVTNREGAQFRSSFGKVRKHSGSRETMQTNFNQVVANDLVEFAVQAITGTPGPHGPSYSILGEAMLNTLNHASRGKDPEPWWASVFFDAERRRSCFTFIDQGVGIFKSHRLTLSLKLLEGLSILDNAQILERLFHGDIPSTTKIPGRGNGIPFMYNHHKANRIKNFTVLANNAIGGAETESYRMLRESFNGTILYWEIGE
ncbi:MAG: hypothetical protein ABSE42_02525 [Bryobacteraceae bacterium]